MKAGLSGTRFRWRKSIALTDGSVVRLSADSGRPEFLRGAQERSQGGYVSTGLVRELGRQTEPLPKRLGYSSQPRWQADITSLWQVGQ